MDPTLIEFLVLGPLEIRSGDGMLRITGHRQQRILAMLLLNADQTVPRTVLLDAVWDDELPRTATRQLQNCVSDLRRQLPAGGSTQITADDAGYRLALGGDTLDLREFQRLVASAGQPLAAGDHAASVDLLRAALAKWRGPALAGLTGKTLESAAAHLHETRLQAIERCVDLELRLERHHELVAELLELVAANPLRERLLGQLMLALYRCDRKADALASYRALQQRLADELGLDPGPALRACHAAILRDEVADLAPLPTEPRAAPPPGPATTGGQASAGHPEGVAVLQRPTPAQLPADVTDFVGREPAIALLDAMLPVAASPEPTGMPVAVIVGPAGVGKTSLAVHWAHRVRQEFPDGQLCVDLRGYAPGRPVTSIEALTRFLGALGYPPQQVPTDLDEASQLFRSSLADRRVLVLLDNVARADDVRPLIPGGPGCLVLVTSRDRLGGLVARSGARRVTLDPFGADEAGVLLRRLIGSRRVAAEPAATKELVLLCGRLPLALRIAAANLGDRPTSDIAGYVAKLRSGDRLAALAVTGDEQAAVRGAFDLSYQGLAADAQRLFRLLGLVPGRDLPAPAAAALCGLPAARTEQLLDELTSAHLLDEHMPGRYSLHDLLRLYAVERASAEETGTDRMQAIACVANWYAQVAETVASTAYPEALRLPDDRPAGPPSAADPPAIVFAGPAPALAWMEQERANLVSLVQHLAAHGPLPLVWRLAVPLHGFFWRRMYTADWQLVAKAAMSATADTDDDRARCAAYMNMADLLMRQSRYREAVSHYQEALTLGQRSGWTVAQLIAGGRSGTTYRKVGEQSRAEEQLLQALALARGKNEPYHEGALLGYLGQAYRDWGRLDESLTMLSEAEQLFAVNGLSHGTAVTWGILGEVRRLRGELEAAEEMLRQALTAMQRAGDRGNESQVTISLAGVARERGRLTHANELAAKGLALAEQANDPRSIVDAHNLIASIRYAEGRTDEALAGYALVLDLIRDSEEHVPEIEAYLGLAAVHRSQGAAATAIGFAAKARDLALREGHHRMAALARDLLPA